MKSIISFLVLLATCEFILSCSPKSIRPDQTAPVTITESPAVQLPNLPFPSSELRSALFLKLVTELERLDGDGLLPRVKRPLSWKKTVTQLKLEAIQAKNFNELGLVFKRLDAAYTNLHAKTVLSPLLDPNQTQGKLNLSVRFYPEIILPGKKVSTFKVSRVKKELLNSLTPSDLPVRGDELIAINDRPMSYWQSQNFNFCKFPLREQCEAEIFDSFRKELLGWDRTQKIFYTLKRDSRIWKVEVPFELSPPPKSPSNNSTANSNAPADPCGVDKDRYHSSYHLAYRGYHACVFESEQAPGVPLLRIESFAYRGIPQSEKIRDIHQEVETFWNEYWKLKAPTLNGVIIDVMDNGGGDEPVDWYALFFAKPYQEQWVEFKKTKEIEDPKILDELFYKQNAKALWLEQIKKSGIYGKIKEGSFLPPVPQFCPKKDRDCTLDLYEPRKNEFHGKVGILINHWCISSCVGFVWNFSDVLKKRTAFFGFPDSGDSTYGRVYLDLYIDEKAPGGFITEVNGRPGQTQALLPPGAIVRQIVSVTRSTDQKGKILSGIPMKMNKWVPLQYHYKGETYEETAARLATTWIQEEAKSH